MKENDIEKIIGDSFSKGLKQGFEDTRYKKPKKDPKASKKLVEETIDNNDIYKWAKEIILNAQKDQVAYGIDKYPEPLSSSTWTMIETMKHIIEESVDKLHYEVMLLIKLELEAKGEFDKARNLLKDDVKSILYADNEAIEYAKADIEAMEKAHENMFDHNKHVETEKGIERFKMESHMDYENNFNNIRIDIKLDRDDDIDSIHYAIKNELEKIKNEGAF